MAEHLAKLAEFLSEVNPSANDLLPRLRSDDSVKQGFEQFYLVLKSGLAPIDGDDGNPGFLSWSDSQIQFVVSIGQAIASLCRYLSVDQTERIVVGVMQELLVLALCYLEKSDFRDDDLSTQINMVSLIEIACLDGNEKPNVPLTTISAKDVGDLWPRVFSGDFQLDGLVKCIFQGGRCSNEEKLVDRLLITLMSEVESGGRSQELLKFPLCQDMRNLSSLARHLGLVHFGCVWRLILVCKNLVQMPIMFDEKMVPTDFHNRLSFCVRILKLLGSLCKDVQCTENDVSLLQAIASFADAVPNLFGLCVEFASHASHTTTEGTYEALVLSLLEKFLNLARLVSFNSSIFLNIQACIAASILSNLDSSVWRYDKSSPNAIPPLAYFPQTVIYVLGLILDLKRRANESQDLKVFDSELIGRNGDSLVDSASCHVHLEKIPLLKSFTVEEVIGLIFPSSIQWADNLFHLAYFLHSEGVKLRPKLEKMHPSSVRSNSFAEVESQVSHEDEAIFGNLFSESSRSLGSTELYDQAPIAISSSNLPMQAAKELLSFLKACIFCHDWFPAIYEDACKKLSPGHVDILFDILGYHFCCEDKISDTSYMLHEEERAGEVVFELLLYLLRGHALSDSLVSHLVQRILTVENGKFVYNEITLALLAQTLLCRPGSAGANLRSTIFDGFVSFINEKVEGVCSESLSLKDLIASLPSVFHVEILLMTFHLSSEGEKANLANLVASSIQKMDGSSSTFNCLQLSCWALLLSRLLVLLSHMISHPSTCPTSLLMDLRVKLKEIPGCGANLRVGDVEHSYSWVALVAKDLAPTWTEDESISNLIGHLIDDTPNPPVLQIDLSALRTLSLSWDDICETLPRYLGFWMGKKAATVEDLVVERYFFMLCWKILVGSGALHSKFTAYYHSQDLDISSTDDFICMSFQLLGHCEIAKRIEWKNVLVRVLTQLCTKSAQPIKDLGWDCFREGSWLSLILRFLNTGISKHGKENSLLKVGFPWKDRISMDDEYVAAAENFVSCLVENGDFSGLLRMLSSLLRRYLKIFSEVLLATLSSGASNANTYLLLIKHTEFARYFEGKLVEKNDSGALPLNTILDLPKLEAAIVRRGFGNVYEAFSESMIHGLPFNPQTDSAIFSSCILSIREIFLSIDGLLKLGISGESIDMEQEVLREILDSVMIIKFNQIFEGLHEKCEDIRQKVCAVLGMPDFTELFLLKHLEGFVRSTATGQVDGSTVLEQVVAKIIDILDGLRKDSSKSTMFYFFLGQDNIPEHVAEFYQLQRGDLSVLIDSLDNCYTESVNLKVFNFFVHICSLELCLDLRRKIQEKITDMDLRTLSSWVEKRLLGSVVEESKEVKCASGNSLSFREATMNFINCLLNPPSDSQTKELHRHLFEAMLMSLDTAFVYFDIHTAKSYFHFAVQLSKEENLMKLLLKKTLMLMSKLAGSENLLPGLKFLFGVIGSLLSHRGSFSHTERFIGKSLTSRKSTAGGHSAPRSAGSGKHPEAYVLSVNQEGGSVLLECDVTSVDEDEDDGTSDGEVASLDKEEEEDTNSERALASKVCTFTSSGSNFMEQHWYFCYTCDLTVSKGCCSVCAKVCHRGHRVVYSRSSRFFCDCGEGGVRGSSCQCLKPRKFTGAGSTPANSANNFQSFLPFPEDTSQPPESDSDLDEDSIADADNYVMLSLPKEILDRMSILLQELNVEDQVLELCSSLLPSIIKKRESSCSKDKRVNLGKDKVLSSGADLLQLKKAYKSGSLDLKIKADYANTKDLKSLIAGGALVKSLLSVSVRGRLAVGEGDKVAIFDVGQLIGQATIAPVTADKANVKPLSRNIVRFEIVHLAFNPVVENYLAVAGLEDCQILTVNPRGEVTDRLAIELALQGAYIRRIDWVPGSQVGFVVVTNKFVKIYDLSQDNISPMHYFTLPSDMIVDAVLFTASQGRLFLLVLSEQGNLYRFELSSGANVGATPLKEIIQFKGKDIHGKGSSLYFSSTYRLVFLSYQNGTSVVGRLSPDATYLTEMSCLLEEEPEGKLQPAGLHRWKQLIAGSGLFVSFSSMKSNAALAVSMGSDDLCSQNLRHATGSSSPVVGITAYKPLSKDKVHCLVLHDDGSLQIFSLISNEVDADLYVTAEKVKKLGIDILNNKAYVGLKPEFPLDFFEKTVCITADVKLAGDAIRNSDSEGAKQSLASEDGFIEGPSPTGFKISVSNPNPDTVMVGIRVHVGNTSASHIPSELTIFQRVIKFDEGMRSWYDIPFTVAESLLADEEFVISIGPTFNGTALPRLDSLEVYGRAKDEFGWKEKMDALLDMEARVLGHHSLHAGSMRKRKSAQFASIHEQVVADGLKLLSMFYSLCGSRQQVELSQLKCKQLLETIFESDGEPVIQAAASHVLQAVFPKKEIYYQVKDTMRLLGVVKATSVLSTRLKAGGTGSWIVEEFNAQMRAISKIASSRKSNLAKFLESNGSEVVDLLMQVLWGILESEQLDTQAMNNIVMSSVELIYSYAECLESHGRDTGTRSVAPAVRLLKKLLFFSNEAVQTSSSLAISSRLLQVPFPKQTMLTADDAIDNITSSMPVRTGGGNVQVMIEEDALTSSVQYCCDGCSTVPILRRRWHCTVCPDFDLCEGCYEVLDADCLPPPHSREHPMAAIPIEVESLGADGNGIHFSADEIGGSNLSSAITGRSMQSSVPSIHDLEPSEPGEFSASIPDPVSISATKRAVNTLVLSELLDQLKGWMETTSGVRAIPVMQLFYRLSSAIGGPFMDSSKPEDIDLEKLIKWLLDEINLNKPFVAKARSSFSEVLILVCMFFSLMLRNWHQPGSDGSISRIGGAADTHDKRSIQSADVSRSSSDAQGREEFASQLLQAGAYLRNQAFVDYLMSMLQQLVHVFKSSTSSSEGAHGSSVGSGCGSLLTVRRDLPAGNYAPFFSDSYAKAHRADIFMDFHRLLLENVFRLVYTLVRPEKQEKVGDKEKLYKTASVKDLKLDGFQDVLCSYINNPHTTFVRRYARRLFLHLCGSKTQYYSVRDSWQFSNEVRKLYKHIDTSSGFGTPFSYERSVKIVKSLSTLAEVAATRPRNWQKYCLRHGDVLPFLLNVVFYLAEESVVQTLKLLGLAFYCGKDVSNSSHRVETGDVGTGSNRLGSLSLDSKKKKKGEDGTDSLEKSYVDMEVVLDVFNGEGGDVLRQFIDVFLLEWNSSSVRSEAKCVLHGLWHHGRHSFKENLLVSLLQKVKYLPMYGQNIVEYTELVVWLLARAPDNSSKKLRNTELVDRCLTPDVIKIIFETLHSQNDLIANHANSRIYGTLSNLVEFEGYYLESEPCVACSSPEVPYSRMKLESLKSETKFTDNRIIVKCTGSYTIQSMTMNVHDARKSKSVKVLNLYYNNRPVSDLSELKNNWSLWKRAKSCHLGFNQTELKVEYPIPITACNFMIELDSFYENLQALSLEPLQCPRCSRPVTDKHGICSNCHENAYQCRQCRNINYENLDSFLCNECGYSKYGRFEFNFMAKPSFTFDNMENDEDMKRGLAAIESESENAHRRYQQLLGFKKPLLKIISSIGESDLDSQHKDSVQQMMASLPGPSGKINRKIALLGVLYGEKCKAAFDSVSKSVQTLQGLRRVLMVYLHQKSADVSSGASRFVVSRSPNNCYGCATTFVTQCLEILLVLSKHPSSKKQLVAAGILSELFENNIHQGPKTACAQARAALCAFSEGDPNAVSELNSLIQKKIMYCLEHHRSIDIALATREEMLLLSEVCALTDEFWESRLRLVFQLLFSSIKLGAKHPAMSEHIILPCLKIISQACTPPKPDTAEKEQSSIKSVLSTQTKDENGSATYGSLGGASVGKSLSESSEKDWDVSMRSPDIQLVSYLEWEKGASYLDFVRRQYKVSQAIKGPSRRSRTHRSDYLALKYLLRWKRRAIKKPKGGLQAFELGSWVTELVLSACSQSIRSEMCILISLLCAQSSPRHYRLLNLLLGLLPATLTAGESGAEYFELLFKMIDSEDARLFLTVRGCLTTICNLITQEVSKIESLERSLHIDISQGFVLHKLIELLSKFLEVPNIRSRFMRDNLLSKILEALIVIFGLIVQKTKLINDCNRLLKDLLDSLLIESNENKKQFIRACIYGLQTHSQEKRGRTCLFILEQLCNMICPSKQEAVYMLILNKAHTQEEFIRGSMTKNPYSSAEIGPLMRDVKNKICQQLDLLGLLEDDYGMELLVAGSIISLDLSIAQVYELVWKKSNNQSSGGLANSTLLASTNAATPSMECPPMTVTYRLQGLDGEATEPMIKELEEDREESQDPEVEFAIAGAVREYGGLEILLDMIKRLRDNFKSNQEEMVAVLNLLLHCCKIRENRRALLRLGALGLLLETARRAFSVDAMEPAEGILLIVESLTLEANESDSISTSQSTLTVTNETGTGQQAKKIVLMFLERLSHPSGIKKSNKQQRNTEMVARILPYLTYGEPAAMEALIQHFNPYLQDWAEFDHLQRQHEENPKDETIAQQAAKQKFTLENFVRVSESLKTSSCGERLKEIILEKGITSAAVNYLKERFAVAGQSGFKSNTVWLSALKLPSVPHILSLLRGLSMGHLPTQTCIDEGGILPLLHALEGVSGENEIGARAENLLDTLADKEGNGDGFLGEKVLALRHATRDEMRRRALRKRKELLQGLGMRQELSSDGGERIVVAKPILEGFEDVEEEEDGLACMVCREGYTLRPTDLLGVYSYSKRVNLGAGTSGNVRGECVYTTVSYFNIIHFQCHQEAKRADSALKNPKKEWEGATLRNNETLCNSVFPVRGPSVPLAQYVRYVDQFWDNLNALGHADGSRLRLLTYDVVLMLARFATGASFSTDSRGGGRESNSRFLPFMIQMARHLLDQGGLSQRTTMAKTVSSYISSTSTVPLSDSRSSTPSSLPSPGTEETVQFMMVNSLLSESYKSWVDHRRSFLQRGIYHTYMQHTHGRSSTSRGSTSTESAGSSKTLNPETASGEELFTVVRPMLVYTGLIEQLQRFFKVKKQSSTVVSSGEDLEEWEVVMKERVLNMKEMVAFSQEMLSWLDDMDSSGDLQEAFDVVGVLADVLSGGVTKCEDFVRAAMQGKC